MHYHDYRSEMSRAKVIEVETFKRSLEEARRSKKSLRFSGTVEDLEEIFGGIELDTTLPKKIGVETIVNKGGSKKHGTTKTKPMYLYKPPTKANLNVVIDDAIELPDATYEIGPEVMSIIRLSKSATHTEMAKMLTKLREYEHLEGPYELVPPPAATTRLTKPTFDERHVKGLFWLPVSGEYKYLRIRIAPSAVKGAGMGAFAIDPIPKGARGLYKGVARRTEDANMYYAWMIKPYDHNIGTPNWGTEDVLYYIDATEIETSNWTRYVNCGPTQSSNNFDSDQIFDRMFYVATRDIAPDEELFIDYGSGYREDNLGMRGKY